MRMEQDSVLVFNLENLIKKSKYIQSLCINDPGIECFGPMLVTGHALPLINKTKHALDTENWNLDEETKATIQKYVEELYDYAKAAIKENEKEVLPPWIVFPLYNSITMGWRMGLGEDYEIFFCKYIQHLKEKNPDECKRYVKKYPRPEYFDNRCKWYDKLMEA